MEKKETGLAEVRRVFYERCAQGKTPSVRDVYEVVGGNYNEVVTLVREVNRERTAAQTIIGGLPEDVQNPILSLLSSLVAGKEEVIRNLYRTEQKMFEESLDQLRTVESRNNALETKLARLQGDHKLVELDLQVKLAAKTELNATIEHKCGELERDKERLVRENEAIRAEAAQVRAELGRIEGFSQTSEKQAKEQEARLTDKQRQLTEAQTKAAAAEARIDEMQHRIADLEKTARKLDDTLAALESTRTELSEARSRAAVAEARCSETDKKLDEMIAGAPREKQPAPPREKLAKGKEATQ